jgi:hypothetical protein
VQNLESDPVKIKGHENQAGKPKQKWKQHRTPRFGINDPTSIYQDSICNKDCYELDRVSHWGEYPKDVMIVQNVGYCHSNGDSEICCEE